LKEQKKQMGKRVCHFSSFTICLKRFGYKQIYLDISRGALCATF